MIKLICLMVQHQLLAAKLHRVILACIYAALLWTVFGVVADARAQLNIDRACAALDMSTEDCALIALINADTSWDVNTNTSIRGVSSLASPGDAERSCLELSLSRVINSFSVAGRTSSEGGYNGLSIETLAEDGTLTDAGDRIVILSQIDNVTAPYGSIVSEWFQETYYLQFPSNSLFFCYSPARNTSFGENRAWIDNLSFDNSSTTYTSRVCEALDIADNVCATISNITYDPPGSPWTMTARNSVEGATSMHSGRNLGVHSLGNERNCMTLHLPLPVGTRISLQRRVSSRGAADFLMIGTDDRTLEANFSPAAGSSTLIITLRDWEPTDFEISFTLQDPGSNDLTFCYMKTDNSTPLGAGLDRAWIDALRIRPALTTAEFCDTLDLTPDNCSQIQAVTFNPVNFPWRIETDTSVAGETSLRSAQIMNNQQSCIEIGVSRPDRTLIEFSRRISSQPGIDILVFSEDFRALNYPLRPAADTIFRDWSRELFIVPAGNSILTWCYTKNAVGTPQGEDRAWIDELSFTSVAEAPLSRDLVCLALDMSIEDCAQITSVTADPPDRPWFVSDVANRGDAALRSGDIEDNQTSCLVLGVSLRAISQIAFSLLANSEAVNDFLYFEVDGRRLVDRFTATEGSFLRNWEPLERLAPAAASSLSWCYTKNDSTSNGADSGWLDALSFSAVAAADVPLSRAVICQMLDILPVEKCALITNITSVPVGSPWVISTTATEGHFSLRSGDIDDNLQSCLMLNVSLPGNRAVIQFSRRASSQPMADLLTFSVNDNPLDYRLRPVANTILRDWGREIYIVKSGNSTLSWCYQKDSRTSEGEDSVWIDNLSVSSTLDTPLTRDLVCLVLDMNAEDCTRITSVSTDRPWFVSSVAQLGANSLRSEDIDHNQTSCLVLEVTLPAPARIRFSLRTNSEAVNDYLFFENNDLLLIDRFAAEQVSGIRDWEPHELFVSSGISNLRWCYTKNGSDSFSEDSGWLDVLSFADIADVADIPLSREVVCQILDLTTAECALITAVAAEPPASPWFISTTATAGGTALRSVSIDNDQQSCIMLGVALPVRTLIQFSRRVSSQPADELYFATNGQRLGFNLRPAADTVVRDWSRELHILQSGVTTLSWCYAKDGSTDQGEDSAWIDDLSITSTINTPLTRELICLVLDLNTADCARITSVSSDPPNRPWFVSSVALQQGTSLRSGNISNNQTSCLVLGTAQPVSSMIRFSVRTQSEGVNDFLYFEADGIRLVDRFTAGAGSVLRNWEQQELFISGDISELRWCYTKNDRVSTVGDSSWVDALSFVDIADLADVPLSREVTCQVLDMTAAECALITSVASEPAGSSWFISPIATEGSISLRSPDIDDDQQSCLVFTVSVPTGQTLVQFARRVSSQPEADELSFAADGSALDFRLRPAADTILRDWSREVYIVQSDVSSISWCYTKDRNISEGEDSAWIDDLSITFTADALLTREFVCLILDMSIEDCTRITGVAADPPNRPWFISSVARAGNASLRSADIDDNQTSCVVLEAFLPADSQINFYLRSRSEALFDHLYFEANNQRLLDNFSPQEGLVFRNWELNELVAADVISSMRWCYTKNGSISTNDEGGWLDQLSFVVPEATLTIAQICSALDLSIDNCSQIRTVSFEPPGFPWLITTKTSIVGGTSLRSPNIPDNRQICLVLGLELPANSAITVAARTSSEGLADQLRVFAGSQLFDAISADAGSTERDWLYQTYYLPDDIPALSWCYVKDRANSEGDDSVWIDSLSFRTSGITYQNRICDALDLTDQSCAMIGSVTNNRNYLWTITTETSVLGDSSLRSRGAFNNLFGNSDNCFSISLRQSLPGPTRIRYSRRISAEVDNARLLLGFNDAFSGIDSFSAENTVLRDWEQGESVVPGNVNALTWCYIKDRIDGEGADSIWIDALSFVTPGLQPLCDTLDLPQAQCAMIRSVTYDPPQNRWLTTTTAFIGGDSALVSPPLDAGQTACLTLDIDSTLPAGSYLTFDWRTTSPSGLDILELSAGSQQLQISNMPQWQKETFSLNGSETTLRWCYRFNSTADSQTARAWLDNLLAVSPDDRYAVQIRITRMAAILAIEPDSFQFQVTVTAQSPLLPTPTDWVLIASSIDNIASADTTWALVFSGNSAQLEVLATPTDPLQPSIIRLALEDRPLLRGVTVTSLTYMLPARELASLDISAADSVTQTEPAAPIEIAVTVKAADSMDFFVGPRGLVLTVTDLGNTSVSQSTYALTFAGGTARTIITVDLTSEGVTGSIDVSVSSGEIETSARVTLKAAPPQLDMLEINIPAEVAQSTANAVINIEVKVSANGTDNEPFNPVGLLLTVTGLVNASVQQNSFVLTFADGTAEATIIADLIDGESGGMIEMSVSSGDISDSAVVGLVPPGKRVLSQLSVTAPAAITQTAADAAIDIAVTVTARDNFNLPFEPTELRLTIDTTDNVSVSQGSYPLTFAAGTAQTTITADLIDESSFGRIEVSVSSGTINDSAATLLIPSGGQQLTQLAVVAPAAVTQTAVDAAIDIAVTVTARDNFNLLFEPEGLVLRVTDLGNARVPMSQSTYALTFTEGTAQTTVTVELTARGIAGSIGLSVIGSEIESTARVTLNPTPVLLTQLSVVAPAAVAQSTPDTMVEIAVTVTATDNYGTSFEPEGLVLRVTDLGNADVQQSTYALTFIEGTAAAAVTVELTSRDIAGSIGLSVSRGEISDSAVVGINPALRLLTQLAVVAPAEVTQTAVDATIDIAVTVTARDNFNLLFEPAGLVLRVTDLGNADVPMSQSTFALTFTEGTAQTTVTVELTARGIAGSIGLSVIGSEIESTARVTLNPTPVLLAQLSVVAPAAVAQSTPDTMVEIAVTVTATDNYGTPFEPEGLVLRVTDLGNADVQQSTYALTFIGGTAAAAVTVGLTARDIAGSIELSVSRGEISDSAVVGINPAVRLLTQLAVGAPAAVTQTAIDAAIDIAVTVTARDNFNLLFEPAGLVLRVTDLGNADVQQSTFALTFTEGTAAATVTVELTARGIAGSIGLSVIGSEIESTARVTLNPTPVLLTQLSVVAPAAVTQSTPDTMVEIAVTVTATNNYGAPFEPEGLILMVTDLGDADVQQSTYALTFIGGTAAAAVTVGLTARDVAGSIELSVSRGEISDSAVVGINPAVRLLTQLAVGAPAEVTQTAIDAAIDIAVTVTARDNFNLLFEPAGLVLRVTELGNADVQQSTYALTFTEGTARATVTVELTARGIAGSIGLSVIGSEIESTARVTLNPTPVLLAMLTITAPEAVSQSTPDTMVEIAVTVTATDNYGAPFEPEGLVLRVTDLGDADVPQSTFALTFTEGTARTTITVGLTARDVAGSIGLSVSRGEISDSAVVGINPAVRLLTQLAVGAPAAVTQTAVDTAIDIAVTVTARDNFNLLFEPAGLVLRVTDLGNADVQQSTYALTFTEGTAAATVTVELTARGIAGSIGLSVIGSEIESTARVTLNPTPVRLARLTITAPRAVSQSTPGVLIPIAVTVTATDNYGAPFGPEGLVLRVTDLGNADVSQSTFALTFIGATAMAAITVELTSRDVAGSIELSVSSGEISDSAVVQFIPPGRLLTQLAVVAPAAVTQTTVDAAIDIVVTVTARDNFNLLFEPEGLVLRVTDLSNADVSQSTFSLTFAGGTARATVRPELTARGIAGSIGLSVIGSEIESTARVTLTPAPVRLARLTITAPRAVTQSTPGVLIPIAVTVTATDNYGAPFEPTGLELLVADPEHADMPQSTFALTFTDGFAQTTFTVDLTDRDVGGSIELSVSRGEISDFAVIGLMPAVRQLTQISIVAPAAVNQIAADAAIDIAVDVVVRDNFNLPFEPTGLVLRVTDLGNADVQQSTYALTFTENTARPTFTVRLIARGMAGSIEVSVSSGGIESTARITLNPTPVRLARLSITAPAAVTQSTPDTIVEIAVTVTATDNYGAPFEPIGLELLVTDLGNADMPQSTFALTFTDGFAQTTLTVDLTDRDVGGSIELAVSSDSDISDFAVVRLIPPVRLLTQLSVVAPKAVTQTAIDAAIDIAVDVVVRDNFNLPFEPTGLVLMIDNTDNARAAQSTFALTFTEGTAQVTVTVELISRGNGGNIEVSVSGGDIESTASITLNPTPVRLAELSVVVADEVIQSTAGAVIVIPVTVTATDNYGAPFEPIGLELRVEGSDTASVPQSTYALTFTAGTARTTISVGLTDSGVGGSIEVSVSSGTISDFAAVLLIPPGTRLLTQLSVMAPAAITQTAVDAAIDIAVTVIAGDNFNLPFEPTGLALRVTDLDNASVPQSTYALSFEAGTAQTTVTVGLISRGLEGNIEVSVIGSDIESTASITLNPAPVRLAALSVVVADEVTQSTAGAVIEIAVTVTATDNYGNLFEPTGLELRVEATDNAGVPQSTYALTFTAGTARTTVMAGLTDEGSFGRIEVSVSRGDISDFAATLLIPSGTRQLAQLSVMAPAVVTQTVPDAAIDIAVTVTARDNFGLPFEPTGLALRVAANMNSASVPQSVYALTFAAGIAQTTITVELVGRDIAGSIEVSVSSGTISDSTVVELNPAVRLLTRLSIMAPAAVTQTAADAAIDIVMTVTARDNFNLPLDPVGLQLRVEGSDTASVPQSTYALTFTAGTARTTISVGLTDSGVGGSIEVSVSRGTISDFAAVLLIPPGSRVVTQLSVVAPKAVTQTAVDAAIDIAVTVTARDNFGLPFEPAGLALRVTDLNNADVVQSTYALSFAAGTAETTITVGLTDRGLEGNIEVSVIGSDIESTARVTLNPTPVQLAMLSVVVADEVTQSTPDTLVEIVVTVTATDNYGTPFEPVELELLVTDLNNANVAQSTYALSFTAGTARTTITVELTDSDVAGSIEVSVNRGAVSDSAMVGINPAVRLLTQLSLTAPAAITQTAPDAAIDIAVTATARDNFNLLFEPAGLVLRVTDLGNARVPQSTYALSFAAGTAETTITVGLTDRGIGGNIEVSVIGSDIPSTARVTLNPTPVQLAALSIVVADEVIQSTAGAVIEIPVTVAATNNYGNLFEPTGLELRVEATDNASVSQSTYALSFAAGMAQTTATAGLIDESRFGRIEVSVSSGTISDFAAVLLIPPGTRLLAQLSVMAPAVVTQTAADAAIDIAVTVIAGDNFNLPFEPTGLALLVTDLDNARVPQSTYALSFAAGTAETTITVGLTDRGIEGNIEVSVIGSDVESTARVTLNPAPARLAALSVVVADEVTQSAAGAVIEIPVTVAATNNYGNLFEPTGLELRVEATDNARVSQSTYALSFAAGMAQTTVMAELIDESRFGRIEVSVSSGDISDSTATLLIPSGTRQLAQLSVMAPAAVTQAVPDATIDIAVTVTARDNFGLPFEPAGLALRVAANLNSASVPQSAYALSFAAGIAQTTITVGLVGRDIAGSIEVSVSSGTISDSTVVELNPAVRLLTRLSIMAPAAVTQTAADAAIDIAVTVTARDNFNLPLDLAGLQLRVDDTGNADVSQSNYALTFIEGTAQITVTVGLTSSGIAGSIEVSVSSGDISDSVAVVLIPPGSQLLTQLAVVAPKAVTQTAPDAAIDIAVTVTARDNFGLPFEPAGLALLVEDTGNASVPQSNYDLTFIEGTAQTTVTVSLTDRGIEGNIEMSVSSGDILSTASITLNPVPRVLASVSLSAASSSLVQTAANTPVMAELILTALDNYGDPSDAGNIIVQFSASNGALVQSSLTVIVEASGTAQQSVDILPQNDLDTVVTVQLLRGTLDQAVQLLPDGGIQIAVRARRVLRQLQLSLANQVSPLRQIDSSLSIRADIRLIGLDQYDQPIAFSEVGLIATAEPTTTQVALNPALVAATAPEGALTVLVVMFPDPDTSPGDDTTITITIANAGSGVTTNNLVLRALPDRRPPLQKLNVDTVDPGVSELDLIIAMRWLTNPQGSTASLVANLAISSTSVMQTGIDNLLQLFNNPENLDRIDLNGDDRADQLDLRILVRYLSGLRGTALAEQEVSEDLIRLLLGRQP